MSSNIIKKCIEELQKPEFRKDYVLGLLEALDDSSTQERHISTPIYSTGTPSYVPPTIISDSTGGMPPRPLIVPAADPEVIRKLKGGATVEEMPVPLNAKPQES